MPLTSVRAALAVVATVATGYGLQPPRAAQSWPPPIQKAAGSAPVLSASDALKTFSMPPGYRIELVASEPMIQDPIALEWDADGRMWAIELPGYMRDIRASGEYDPIARIVVLEDTNADGVMDKRTVFADGLIQPRGLELLDRGVLVGEPPNVWLMRDTDGDLRADTKDLVTSGYGRRETNVEVNANSLHWALDNRIYSAGLGVDLSLGLKAGSFDVQPSLSRGQWGMTQDDAGRIYRNHNESVLHVDLVPTPYFARNPSLLRTRGSHETLVDVNGDVNAVWPAHQTPGTNRAYQRGILRDDGTLAAFTAACAPTVYRGDRLPTELSGNVFVAEPVANLVSRLVVTDDGSTLRARKAYERSEFLTSTDERFRPVNLSSAPDGTLYVVDMYRGIIQHQAYITEYLRDQIAARQLEQPRGLGRIYRVVHDTTRRDVRPALSARSPARLVEILSHPNGWWRDTAQRLLVERAARVASDGPVVADLVSRAEGAPGWRTRLHALWTLDGIDRIAPATVIRALKDQSREVRLSAVRIAERWLGEANQPIQQAVAERIDDADWNVRAQVAASLGALPPGLRETSIVSMLERHGSDPIVLDAGLSGLRGAEATALEHLLTAGAVQTPARDSALTLIAATIVRSEQNSPIQRVFGWAAEGARPSWQRSALLRGAEVAVLGAEMPGTPRPRKSEAALLPPCPTCPGARGGPGGGYAFPQAHAATTAGGRGGTRSVRLNGEPGGLQAIVAAGGALAARASAVLARMEWPGKPGGVVVAHLTREEQERFDAGQEVYRNLCTACHQPDGRGQERVAPSLVGSTLALAAAAIPVRVLLHGKEGPVGLMPPVGSLTDEQIAAVLTYIRREWGQAGTPVTTAVVTETRALTSGRTRPWTNEELLAIGTRVPR
jgi:putative membrane-bound dehydrogenase-like protein